MPGRVSLRRPHSTRVLIAAAVASIVILATGLYLLLSSGPGNGSVTMTEVIEYTPPPVAGSAMDGSCFSPSLAVTRSGVWRCSVENQIYDPCFGSVDASEVICVQNPVRPDEAVKIVLQTPLSEVEPFAEEPPIRPWTLETSDGVICSYLTGATGPVNGERLNYGCTEGTSIIGDPESGAIWTARSVVLSGSLPEPGTTVPEVEVTLRRVWE